MVNLVRTGGHNITRRTETWITEIESDNSLLGRKKISSSMKWTSVHIVIQFWGDYSSENRLGEKKNPTNNQLQLLIKNLIVMQPPKWNNILFLCSAQWYKTSGVQYCLCFQASLAASTEIHIRLKQFRHPGTFTLRSGSANLKDEIIYEGHSLQNRAEFVVEPSWWGLLKERLSVSFLSGR